MIKIAVVGIGNCASSLVQGIAYCRALGEEAVGVPFPVLGGYRPADVDIVCALDIDERKVGRDLSEAIFAAPNCTAKFWPQVPRSDVTVQRGPVLDGVSALMRNNPPATSFRPSDDPDPDAARVVAMLRDAGAEIVLNFLPVGSQQAAEFYAGCALEAGAAFVNAIPVFLASNPQWAGRFAAAGLPILGDDFKAQLGATIIHRNFMRLFDLRGARIDRTYQLNIGGNTDFLNMMDADRLTSKRESKTEAVQTAAAERLADDDIRIGPSDYVPWLNDQKVAYVRLEGRLFGGVPLHMETRLSVEDSPNAAAMALIALRCARIARDRGLGGAVEEACGFLFKHPPRQMDDTVAHAALARFAELVEAPA